MKKYLKITAVTTLFLTLIINAGCSSNPNTMQQGSTSTSDIESQITQFKEKNDLQCWSIKGKAGAVPYDPSLPKGGTAHLLWKQQDLQYWAQLNGPFGTGKVQVEGLLDGEVKLTTHKGDKLESDSAEDLLGDTIGWYIPLENFTWWVRGLPADSTEDTAYYMLNDEGHIKNMKQGDWLVEYIKFQRVNGITLPKTIRATHRRVKITVSLNRWDLKEC